VSFAKRWLAQEQREALEYIDHLAAISMKLWFRPIDAAIRAACLELLQ